MLFILFFLFSKIASAGDLPLESSTYSVQITGAVAEIELEQVFRNNSERWMEAEYSFPLDGDAAVDDMSILVGNREIVGEIQEREEAKKNYEAAKANGQAAGLTEQQRDNLFTQRVANIPPGEDITVRLHVVQPVNRVDGEYELVIPLVIGPRFSSEDVQDVAAITPAVASGDTGVSVNISVSLRAGFEVNEVYSPTHKIAVHTEGSDSTSSVENVRPNKDFVYRWSLSTDEPEAIALRQEDHMLIRFEAPDVESRDQVVARELIWVIDTSGSQEGLPLDMAKQAMGAAFDGMGPKDRFSLIQFADESSFFSPEPLAGTDENLAQAREWVNQLHASGGTRMIRGVYSALDMPEDPSLERYIVFLTDGLIGDEQAVLGAISDSVGGARVFAFGLGNGTNRWLIEEMAIAGGGRATFVTGDENPALAVDRFMEGIDKPVLTDISIDWGEWEVDQVHPGRIPDLMAGQPLELAVRLNGGTGPLWITGRLAGQAFEQELQVESGSGTAVASLWARAHVASLEREQRWGEIEEVKQEILDTALEYSLLTQYTSFVAIERRISNRSGDLAKSEQPQELPEGMNYETSVSRRYTPPGDPLLTVDAPEDARAVLAVYPWGDTVHMRWDDLRGRWYDRFLVPRDVPDGEIEIVIFVLDADNGITRRVEILMVDSQAEEFEAWLDHNRRFTTVHVVAEEPLRAIQVQPVGRPDLRVRINVVLDDAMVYQIQIPGHWDDVELLVTDRAMNTLIQRVQR
jgi:Ca-activated chloride channel family protein